MRDFFARTPTATWPGRRLHLYVLGTPELRAKFNAYHRALISSGVAAEHGLGLQPAEWAHATVQSLLIAHEDLVDDQVKWLVDRLRETAAGLPALRLRVGAAAGASRHAVELAVEPDVDEAWERMVAVLREAITDVLGEEGLPEPGANLRPHVTLAYGIGDGDSGSITSALSKVRSPTIEVPVEALYLVNVTQHSALGRYTWQPVAELPLRGTEGD